MPANTVFVVDDDKAVCKSLSFLLRAAGHDVETFASAAAFLNAYEPSRRGCLVLDVRMPRMTGLELQQELNARAWRIPAILITGHGTVPMAIAAMKAGAFDFIEKPLRDDSFNNPGVAYAVSQGASDALAPYAFSNYQQGLSNALAAAQQVGQNFNAGQGNQLAAIGQVGQNYNTDYANQLKALALAPQTQSLNFNDINQLFNAGAESQAQNQANLNAAINQWNYGQQLPMEMLANYGNAIQGGYGSTSTVTQPYFQNQTANLLGGALGGAALGGMLGNTLGLGTGGGALGGAGLGALLAFV